MTDPKFEYIDSEDASDLVAKFEKSFDIKFGDTELMHINTLGELCDHISNKIQLEHSDDCTTQQAFYKLRAAILTVLQLQKKSVSPNQALVDLLPRPTRRKKVKQLEAILGFNLNILRPPRWVKGMLALLLFASIIGFYFNSKIALGGFLLSFYGLKIANRFGNELNLQTVGQVAEKMARENYSQSRRNPKTFNKSEIEKILIKWFSEEFDVDKNKLPRETKFI